MRYFTAVWDSLLQNGAFVHAAEQTTSTVIGSFWMVTIDLPCLRGYQADTTRIYPEEEDPPRAKTSGDAIPLSEVCQV